MYVVQSVPPGQPEVRSVATFGVDPVNRGMVTWIGAPPVGVTVCRALRAISAPVTLPFAVVVTCPAMAPGEVLPPRSGTSGIVPMAVPAETPKVMVALYVTPVLLSAALTIS